MSDDKIVIKVMIYKENKYKFIKLLDGLPVEEKSYIVDALKDEEVKNKKYYGII